MRMGEESQWKNSAQFLVQVLRPAEFEGLRMTSFLDRSETSPEVPTFICGLLVVAD